MLSGPGHRQTAVHSFDRVSRTPLAPTVRVASSQVQHHLP
jgi:hypothetical protein